MKKFDEYLEESLAAEIKTEPKSAASKQARKMGLTYMGFGRYADAKGNLAYTVVRDKLVPYKKQEEVDNLYYKAHTPAPGANPEKTKAVKTQADQFNRTLQQRSSEDRKILKQKDKDVAATAKALTNMYKPELYDDNELEAIQNYTGDAYLDVNRYLYKGHDEGADKAKDQFLANIINGLDSAFEETQTPFPFTVYTGLSGRYKPEKIQPGGEYIFRGYISTSLSYDVAISGFTESKSSVVLQIEVKKGQKAIYVDSVSATDGKLEILLPRGSKVKIVSGPHILPGDVVQPGMEGASVSLFHCVLVEDK